MVQSVSVAVSVGRKYFTLTKYGGRNVLNFFGKGSAFADDNTCAYFVDDNDMVLIDFSLEAFPKLRRLDFSGIKTIYVLVTHTHGDHISGIGTLIHYAYFKAACDSCCSFKRHHGSSGVSV